MKQKTIKRCPATITDHSGTYRCSLEEGHRRKHVCLDNCWFGFTDQGAEALRKKMAAGAAAKQQQPE